MKWVTTLWVLVPVEIPLPVVIGSIVFALVLSFGGFDEVAV
jgi:hypothetical protein